MSAHIAIDARLINSTTGRYIERLITYLQDIDTKNHYSILVRKNDLTFWKPTSDNFNVVEADFDIYSLKEQINFLQMLNRLKPDLVHFCMPQQPIAYAGLHVTTVHDLTLLKTYNSDKNWLVFHTKQLVGRVVFKIIAQTSDHIITPTNWVKEDYRHYANIPAKKITVTYEATDSGEFTAEPFTPLVNKQFLLCVGNQADYKNIRRLMQAHQELRKKYPELLLVCVGKLTGKNGVTLARNKAWAEQQGMSGIVYTDFVSDEQLNWLYAHCATYVFPSLMEGFGLPGLEAMSCGAPVASSNATCLPEVYGDAAHYFDAKDVSAMVSAIDDILNDDALRKTLIERGYEQVKKYSWKRMAEQTLSVYKKVLNK